MSPVAGRGFATKSVHYPRRRDVLMIADPPEAPTGASNHPYLVLSPRRFNQATGLLIGAQITHSLLRSKTAIELPTSLGFIEGFLHPERLHTLDWHARAPRLLGELPVEFFAECISRCLALLDPERMDDER
jgi:mRNA interferase MazF